MNIFIFSKYDIILLTIYLLILYIIYVLYSYHNNNFYLIILYSTRWYVYVDVLFTVVGMAPVMSKQDHWCKCN